ncbi:MAG: family N-acetyltransferase [Microbacteriaceae bacterium]|nr:family N-acetyltransferase [Microbacteriaceae bacterium]
MEFEESGDRTMFAIEFLPAASAADAKVVATITGLINSVYLTSEDGLWLDGALRTTEAEVAALIRASEFAAAVSEGVIVGSVRIQRLDALTGEFGMLAADPERRGLGIGRELVAFAEEWARHHGLASMQLEVLAPRTWVHPSKVFLLQWYERIGYRHIRTGALEESHPDLAPLLATPCDFAVYRKDLSARANHAHP